MKRLKKRHWGLHSHGALAGKSTFVAANCRPPLIVVDTDGRFEAVEGLVDGKVYYPEQVIDPLTLIEELIEMHGKYNPKSIAWDSMTKLYSIHARIGFMRGRSGRKTADGKSINRAAELIDKSNAMTIARDLAILGTDVYYCWHTTSGVNGMGKSEIKDMISSIEKERLMTSINVVLEFHVKDGNYGITVVSARDFGGRKSNTGFTIWDKPGNYWRGAAERLERLIYTAFTSKEEMMAWGAKCLQIMPDEAEGLYDYLKESHRDATRSQLTVAWIEHVRGLVKESVSAPGGKGVPDSVAPESEKEEVTEPVESVAEETKPGTEPETKIDSKPEVETATKAETESEEIQDEEPKVRVADKTVKDPAQSEKKPEDFSFDGELITQARDGLEEKDDDGKTTLENVVNAAFEAVPWKYPTPEDALARVPDFPELPSAFKVKNVQAVTIPGAVKIFDWLVFEG